MIVLISCYYFSLGQNWSSTVQQHLHNLLMATSGSTVEWSETVLRVGHEACYNKSGRTDSFKNLIHISTFASGTSSAQSPQLSQVYWKSR